MEHASIEHPRIDRAAHDRTAHARPSAMGKTQATRRASR
ncbi:hypothetical protein ABIC49_002228 [Burkholderia ambifaria]